MRSPPTDAFLVEADALFVKHFGERAMLNEGDPNPLDRYGLHDIAGFCSCGCPNEAADWLANVLRAHELGGLERAQALDELMPHKMSRYVILYWLDDRGWTEHGGNVMGAWLSEKGRAALLVLDWLAEDTDA